MKISRRFDGRPRRDYQATLGGKMAGATVIGRFQIADGDNPGPEGCPEKGEDGSKQIKIVGIFGASADILGPALTSPGVKPT
jgi:hypothetical protein